MESKSGVRIKNKKQQNHIKINFFLFIILLLLSSIFTAFSTETDSLKIKLNTATGKEKLEILNKLAGSFWDLPPNDRIAYGEQAIKLSEKFNDRKSKAVSFGFLGIAYNNIGNTEKSIDYFLKALKIMEQLNDKNGIAKSYVNLGQANFYIENYDKAIEYFQKALEIRNKIGDKMDISQSLILVGNVHAKTADYYKALNCYSKALNIKKEINDKVGISQIYNNIANIYLKTGKMEKILEYRFKSLKIDRELNNKWEIANTTFNIAEYYLTNNEPQKAYPYITESKKLAEELDNKGLINDNIFSLSLYYELMGNFKKALKYQKGYAKITKEQFSSELSEKIAEMETKFQTKKKENEAQAYKLQLEKKYSQNMLLTFSLVIALLIIFFIYYQYKIKKKSNLLLEKTVKEQTKDLQDNIEELKRAERALKTALKRATESDRLKTAFLNTISHELRTPLNAIIGFSEVINKSLPIDEILNFNKIINYNGEHLLNIIENIFDSSLIMSEEVKIKKKEQNINIIIQEVYEKIKKEQTRINKQNIDIINKQIEKDKDLIVYTDHEKLKKILLHILSNALKFTQKGFIEFGYVSTGSTKSDMVSKPAELKFYVKDTGIGISKDKLKIIFDIFRQGDDTDTREYEGIGIGLTISKKLTELLGGKIWVDSIEGKGSTFYFTIPYLKTEN